MSQTSLPPGPKYYQLFKAQAFQQKPVENFGEMWKTYGDIVYLPILPNYRIILFSHPRHAEHILIKHPDIYLKPELLIKNMGLVQGQGLFTSEGEQWQRHRRMMQPAFHQKYLEKLHSVIVECVEQTLETWADHGSSMDIATEMTQLTLKIISQTLFSVDISDQSNPLSQACRFSFNYVYDRMASPLALPPSVPTPNNRRFRQAKQTIDRIVQDLIQDRRQQSEPPFDLLSLLLEAQDIDESNSDPLSDRQLQDEIITLINAGHETSAVSLSWLWMALGQNPEIMTKLQQEIDQVLQGQSVTPHHLKQLTYTRQVIDESLRLYNPGLGLMRSASQDDEIDGYRIPKGSNCILVNTHIFRHPDFWEKPQDFYPEHFTPEAIAQRDRSAYFPFGAGPHTCIGKNLALMELMIILVTVVQKFDIQLTPNQTFEIDPRFTLRPKQGVQVTVTPRSKILKLK